MKKPLFGALFALSLVAAPTVSCIKEDLSRCEGKLTLNFRLGEGATDEAFAATISSVDVFLYDTDRHFLEHRRIERAGLEEFCGTTFKVAAGICYAVCWGNVSGDSRLSGAGGDLENGRIEIASSATGDPLYYAPCGTNDSYAAWAAEVFPNRTTVKDMFFVKAHRTVLVYVKGYEHTAMFDGNAPVVRQTGAGGGYDFFLRADLSPVTLRQTAAYTTGTHLGNVYRAVFRSALIPLRSDMEVYLCHPATGDRLAGVDLRKFVRDNEIADDSVIPVLFTFTIDAGVTVTIPHWTDNPVVPESDRLK